MLENLTQRFSQIVKNLSGQGRLTEANIQEALREVRVALLEADVALSVVKEFIERLRIQALGEKVLTSISPGQALIKIVNDELIAILGKAYAELDLSAQPPAIILLAGLQGSGKTTTAAKLAHLIKTRLKKTVLVTSCDIYRPAAIEQLKTLAQQIDVEFYPNAPDQNPIKIAQNATDQAKRQTIDVVIIDTAGRLHIDDEMMDEIKQIHTIVNPIETLFVVDSMTGQDAAKTAKAFNDALPLTGVILTKLDGDTRGGAALSVFSITGKPIKFVGVGEKIDALEPFHPDRMASRILGMGDIVTLVEEVQRKADQEKAEKIAKKFKKGKGFDFEDFLDQLEQMNKLGGIGGIMSKLPGIASMPQAVKSQVNDKMLVHMKAIVQSMTRQERRFPDVINGSRRQRIARGSGTEVQEVNRLLKQFKMMQKMFKKISQKGGMLNMMRQMGQLKGMIGKTGFPPM
ncbi:MAG: signal recognition particle protein [Gammaproteobacteria bacterium]|nr:signal recognition particle protein [Gammaproteobacteria bacterium]